MRRAVLDRQSVDEATAGGVVGPVESPSVVSTDLDNGLVHA